MPNASLTIDGTEVIKKENGVVSLKNTNADTSLSFPANHAGIKAALNASGSAPVYACRAWVNFDGTTNTAGFCTILDGGNVSTVADNGTGDYTVNFTTAMPSYDYAVVVTGEDTSPGLGNAARGSQVYYNGRGSGYVRVQNFGWYGSAQDVEMSVVIIH